MSLCSELKAQFDEVYAQIDECGGKQKVFPTSKEDMIEDDNGDIDDIIQSNEEADDYDVEDPHQDIQKSGVKRIDPKSLDFLNRRAKQGD